VTLAGWHLASLLLVCRTPVRRDSELHDLAKATEASLGDDRVSYCDGIDGVRVGYHDEVDQILLAAGGPTRVFGDYRADLVGNLPLDRVQAVGECRQPR
jgi:hypothetical protein